MKYRVAVIGHTGRGDYGHGIDVVWKEMSQCELVAVADADEGGRQQAVSRLGKVKPYASYLEMLEREKPDIVSICPRWIDQHRDMVIAAAERGAHIYMEKPFCRTLREADEMIQACERHRVKLAIAHQTRYSPLLPVIRQLIQSGKLGELLELRGRGKEDRRGGGEDLWVLGSHIMNLIQYFAGEPKWCFAEVQQAGRRVAKEDVIDGPEGIGPLAGDAVHAMFGMERGVTAYFGTHRHAGAQGTRFGLRLLGSLGVVDLVTGYRPAVFFLPDPIWSPGRSRANWVPVSEEGIGQAPEPRPDSLGEGNVAACRDLIASIEDDRQPEANMYEARMTIEMISAVFASHRQQGPVSFPLSNRENPLAQWNASS